MNNHIVFGIKAGIQVNTSLIKLTLARGYRSEVTLHPRAVDVTAMLTLTQTHPRTEKVTFLLSRL